MSSKTSLLTKQDNKTTTDTGTDPIANRREDYILVSHMEDQQSRKSNKKYTQ